jgi:hypothetical protein
LEEDEIPWRMLGRQWSRPPSYDEAQLSEEVAYIAYHFHWPLEQILRLEHGDRRRWAAQISSINERMNEESGTMPVR